MAETWQRFEVRIEITGLSDAQVADDLPDLQIELELWEYLENPEVTWDPDGRRAIVKVQVEDREPDSAGLQAVEAVYKIVPAIFADTDELETRGTEVLSLGLAPPPSPPARDDVNPLPAVATLWPTGRRSRFLRLP